MNIILWILSIFLILNSLLLLGDVASGKSIFAFILSLLAIALVFPPLHSLISQKLPWIKAKGLRIFLAILLFFGCIAFASPKTIYSFASMQICESASPNCETSRTRFVEKTPKIIVTATSEKPIEQVDVTVSDQSDSKVEVFSETYAGKEIQKGDKNYVVELDTSKLNVGTYTIELTPGAVKEGITRSSKKEITVWPTKEDVTQRQPGGSLAETTTSRYLSGLNICSFTVQQAEAEKQEKCPASKTELAADVEVLAFEAELENPSQEPIKLSYTFRGKEDAKKDQYTVLIRKTLEVDADIDFMTYMLKLPDGGLKPGEYDMTTAIETQAAKPIRKSFMLKG